jgi:hypothetical protein
MTAEMLRLIQTAHPFPPTTIEVVRDIKEYAAAALTTAAFTENTNITLEDDPVQVHDTQHPLPPTPDRSAKDLPRHWNAFSALSTGDPENDCPGQHRRTPDRPPPHGSIPTNAGPGSQGPKSSDSRTASQRIADTSSNDQTPRCNKFNFVISSEARHTRPGGGQPLNTGVTARPRTRIYKDSPLHKHKHVIAPTTEVPPDPDLPTITSIADWANLRQTHSRMDFAKFANLHGSHTCPPVSDTSAAALITPAIVQHFAYGNWQGTMEIQDCLSGLFRLLRINLSISLLQQ